MMTIATTKDAMAAARTRMEKAVDDFRKELATLRTGRANAAILDAIRVDYHGTPIPANQLGTVMVQEAIDKLEKDKKISQDEHKRAIEEMEKFTHSETKKIEDLSAAKEKEILEIK